MERAGLSAIDTDRCTFLHWKGMYVEIEYDASVAHSGDRLFWCHKTQNCVGPDGKVADDYECNESRGCYKEL